MYRAIWHGMVLAESDQTVEVEGNQYFPPSSANRQYFQNSDLTSVCPWKGTASYYRVTVDGKANRDAAWYCPRLSPAAAQIRVHVAFWNGVLVMATSDTDPTPETRSEAFLYRLMSRTRKQA